MVADPGRRFRVPTWPSAGLPISRWTYDFEETDGAGCRVTESWTDRRARWIERRAAPDRHGRGTTRRPTTEAGMEATLAALKASVDGG